MLMTTIRNTWSLWKDAKGFAPRWSFTTSNRTDARHGQPKSSDSVHLCLMVAAEQYGHSLADNWQLLSGHVARRPSPPLSGRRRTRGQPAPLCRQRLRESSVCFPARRTSTNLVLRRSIKVFANVDICLAQTLWRQTPPGRSNSQSLRQTLLTENFGLAKTRS